MGSFLSSFRGSATRTGCVRALLALAALAPSALLWPSASVAAKHPAPPVITHLNLSGSGVTRTLNMTLSGRARVTVAIGRTLAGHRAHGRCQTRPGKGKPCSVTVQVAMHVYQGARGKNHFKVTLAGLPAGQYLATVVAQNARRNSARHTLRFKLTSAPKTPTPPVANKPIPAPPAAPKVPAPPPHYTNPTPSPSPSPTTPTTTTTTPTPTTTTPTPTPVTPPQAKTWGASGKATTLVVYDTTGQYGWIGELDAIAAGNLATHFGKITAEPVADYQSGQIDQYTATVYVGSTYNEPIPTAFLNDVLATSHPVIWAGQNIWQLSGTAGGSANSAFIAKYGWDPSSSYFDTLDNPTTVTYNGQTFTRNALNGTGQMLQPHITNSATVKVLAEANCSTATPPANCASQAPGASVGSTFPWAIRSSNLTYVGEDPFSYISETDRYLIFSDLLFDALDPSATPSHQAMVRLEDVSPASNPATLQSFADYMASQNVPFSVNVIPEYTDPLGVDNANVAACAGIPAGAPCTKTLADEPGVVAALKYIESKGGTLNEEGYTHQYSNVPNPYTGISGDDAEFYKAVCSSTQNTATPVTVTATSPCPTTDYVVWTGPVDGDSQAWATERVTTGKSLFQQAGLTVPSVWITPHYFASAPDYAAIDSQFPVRYERETFPSGLITPGAALDYSHTFGQFFPYVVHDAYGEEILPENLGDYEPTAQNGNPPRVESDIINEAKVNLAVRQGFASFFYDANDNPLANLQTIVTGIKNLGYTFVGPTDPTVTGG